MINETMMIGGKDVKEMLLNFRNAEKRFTTDKRTYTGAYATVFTRAMGFDMNFELEISLGGVRDIYNLGATWYAGQKIDIPTGFAGVKDMMRHEMGHFLISNTYRKNKYGYRPINNIDMEQNANEYMNKLRGKYDK